MKARREFMLGAHADMALDRLVRHYALSVTAVIERAIIDAERAATDDMTRTQRARYFRDQMPELLAKAARRRR